MLHEYHHDVHNELEVFETDAAKQVFARPPSGIHQGRCRFPFCVLPKPNLYPAYATHLDEVDCHTLDRPGHNPVSYEDDLLYLLSEESTRPTAKVELHRGGWLR